MKWWHGLSLTWAVASAWPTRAAALASISWSVRWSANSGFKACEAPGPNDAAQKDVTGGANCHQHRHSYHESNLNSPGDDSCTIGSHAVSVPGGREIQLRFGRRRLFFHHNARVRWEPLREMLFCVLSSFGLVQCTSWAWSACCRVSWTEDGEEACGSLAVCTW